MQLIVSVSFDDTDVFLPVADKFTPHFHAPFLGGVVRTTPPFCTLSVRWGSCNPISGVLEEVFSLNLRTCSLLVSAPCMFCFIYILSFSLSVSHRATIPIKTDFSIIALEQVVNHVFIL